MNNWFKKNRVRIRNFILGIVIIGLLTLVFLVIYSYLNRFGETFFPTKRDELGQFGDYFGGALNPIFGLATFVALLITIVYQAKELNASTRELKNSATALAAQNKAIELQSFEQTFFSWLNTYRDLLNSVSGVSSTSKSIGSEQLYNLWRAKFSANTIFNKMLEYNSSTGRMFLSSNFDADYGSNFDNHSSYQKIELIADNKPDEVVNILLKTWAELYIKNEYQLDGLFRVIYRLILWIDSQDNKRISIAQKWLYVSIIRSQLSRIEMVFLFYNGLTSPGEKFKPLIEKYALFDNLTFDSDIGINAMRKHLDNQKFYSDAAFKSELAREKMGLPKSSEETLALATTT